MSQASSTNIIPTNDLKASPQGQGQPPYEDAILNKVDQESARVDVNLWANFWHYDIGVNVIPAISKTKRPKLASWKEWQSNAVSEDQHSKWKREGLYNQGMAVITGKIWRGPNKGKHLACIDCDNQAGIDELLSNCFQDIKTLEELSQKTIVEQHLDNRKKAHIYLISESPLKNRPGLNSAKKDKEDGIPIIEVKSEGRSYMICSPSLHKDGHRYKIIGDREPMVLDLKASEALQESINQVDEKFGVKGVKNSNGQPPMGELFKDDFVAHEGSRNNYLFRVMKSLLLKPKDNLQEERIKDLGYEWNQKHCNPPLEDNEVEQVWRSAKNSVIGRGTAGLPSSMEHGMIIKEINVSPTVFYYADPAYNRIGEGRIDCKYNKETDEEESKIQLTNIIIDAIPDKILIYKNNPLLPNSHERVKITFKSNLEKEFEVGPCDNTTDLTRDLESKHLIVNTKKANEALSCIINAYKEKGLAEYSDDITTGGYYLLKGKLNTVNPTQRIGPELNKNEVLQCIHFLNQLASRGWKNKNIFPTVLKWGIVSPFGFSIKFNSDGFFPWLQMYGMGQTGKTTLGNIVLSIWNLDKKGKSIGFSNIDSVPRFGYAVSKDTYPILVNEVAPLFTNSYGKYAAILELLKHSVESITCRVRFYEGKHYQEILALSPMMLTCNYAPPNDGSYNRRFVSIHFPEVEKKEAEEQREFNSALAENKQCLSVLGDFAAQYIADNPLVLVNKQWHDIAKYVLVEFYRYAGCPTPDWIDYLEEQRDAIDESSEKTHFELRAFMINKINDSYSRNRIWENSGADIDIDTKLDHCLKNKLVPFISEVDESTLIITQDIMSDLKKTNQGIENLTGLKDVGTQLGFNYVNKYINSRRMRVLEGKKDRLLEFIEAEIQ